MKGGGVWLTTFPSTLTEKTTIRASSGKKRTKSLPQNHEKGRRVREDDNLLNVGLEEKKKRAALQKWNRRKKQNNNLVMIKRIEKGAQISRPSEKKGVNLFFPRREKNWG